MKPIKKLIICLLVFAMIMQLTPATALAVDDSFDDETVIASPEIIEADDVLDNSETASSRKVLFEETSLREETVKHFRMEDGSFLAVDYQQPIHYATADGIWNDIDNRLVETTRTANDPERYSSSIGDYKKTFAASLSDSLIFAVNDGKYGISMRLYEAGAAGLTNNAEVNDSSAGENDSRDEIVVLNDIEALPDENDFETTRNSAAVYIEEIGDETLETPTVIETLEESDADAPTRLINNIPVARIVANEELSGEAKETATIAEQVALPHLSTSVIYEDALAGADLHYESIGYDIKESIIVKEPQDEYSFSFVLSLSNLSAELLSDGSVSISDGEKQKFLIPAPYLLDASMTYSDDVGYSLTPIGKNEYLLTVTADAAWMNAENRSFPVQIDPTLYKVASNSTTTAITSSYIQSANPNSTSSGNTSFVYCGKSTSANASGSVMGALQSYFYVSNLPSLPANSRIIRSYLSLYHSGYHGSGELILRAFELTDTAPTGTTYSNWIKSFTWNNHSPRSSEMLDAVDLNSSTLYQYVNWDITKAVLKWYQNSSNNKGLTIEANDMMNLTAYASFGGYAHNASRPKLYVVYRNTVGVESYYDYQTQSMGQAGAGYVSDNSLQLTLVRTHFTSDSTVNPFALTHVYNSAYGSKQFTDGNGMQTKNYSKMVLGAGWKMNVQETVRICNVADTTATYYVYCDADGTEHYFSYDSSAGKYKDEDGLNLSLAISGTTFTISDEKNNKRIFYNGYLSELRDANGNSIYIAYNETSSDPLSDFNPNSTDWRPTSSSTNQITSIYRKNKDASIEWLARFSWDDSNRLFSATDKIKDRITFFNYTTSNNVVYLTSISVLSSSSYRARYVYDTSGSKCLKEVYDVEAKRGVEYKYNQQTTSSGWQICRITEYALTYTGTKTYGATVSAEHPNPYQTKYRYYGDDRMTYGDPAGTGTTANADDVVSEVYFDALGRTVNTVSYNDTDRAQIIGGSVTSFTQNSGTSAKNNRIVAQAGAGMYYANMLKDSSFEACPVSLIDTPASVWGLDNSGGYVTFHNDAPHSGSVYASLKINNTPTATSTYKAGIYQTVYLESNKTYSFSAYIRIQPEGENWNYGSAYLYFADTSGYIKSKSDAINFSTGEIEDGWMRIYVTYTAPSGGEYQIGVRLDNAKATLGVDDMQLEVGNAPSSYNLLRDSSAEFYGTWSTYEGWTTSSGASIDTYSGTIDGSYAIQITGHTGLDRNAYQDVFVSENYRTTYILSGWAKANSLPFDAKAAYNSSERFFGLKATIFYTDNTTEDTFIPFNCYCGDWQYVSGVVVPKKTVAVSKIRVFADYNHNAGTAIFDDIALSKEPVQTYSYDNNGKLNVSTDTGESMSYTYNGADLMQYIGSNGTFGFEYDNHHNVTKITNDGAYQEMTYDGAGNVLSSSLKNTTDNTDMQSSAVYSNNNNTVASVTDVNGNTTSYNYYTTGLLLESVTDAKNHKTTYVYNDDLRNSITRYYSTASSTSALTELRYTYAQGILSELKRKTATSTWHHLILASNKWGQTTTIKINKSSTGSASGTGIRLVTNDYEPYNGKLISQMYGNGSGVEFSYDLLDRLVETRYYSSYNTATPVLTKTVYNIYNGQGFLFETGTKNASGKITNKYLFEHDSLGRLIRSIEFAYTYSGDVATCKLVQRTEHNYDTENRLTSQNWTIGTKNYSESYNYSSADGSLSKMTAATGDTLNFSYDKLKRLQKVEVKDGSTYLFNTAYAYRTVSGSRSSAQVQYRNVRLGNSTDDSSIIEGKKYTYDALGNITMISQSTGDYYPLVKYTYDSQNQLTSEVYYNGHGSTISNITKAYYYTYDTAGNLRKVEEGTVVDGAIVKTDKQTYAYGNSIWVDLLTKVNNLPIAYEGQTVSYNAGSYTVSGTPTSGNPILYNNGVRALDLSWTNGRQLSSVSCYDEQWQVAYSYDADGIRTQKNDDGVLHKYITQNGKVVRETIGSGSTAKVLDFIYDESGRPFALIYTNGTNAPVTYYYILNLQGDVVKLVNENGVEKAKYAYDAWGNILPNSISGEMADINPLRYRGYYYDAETGWYYLQSRYYDPVIHRFINADAFASTGQSFLGCNMFAYCNNSPVLVKDISGTSSEDITTGFFAWLLSEFAESAQEVGPYAVALATGILLLKTIKYILRDTPVSDTAISASDYLENEEAYKDTLSGIASAYDLYQCKEAAEEMAKNNNNRGYLIRLYFPNAVSGYVVAPNSKYGNKTAISSNGYHWGYCDQFHVVRCNVFPFGLPEDEWIHAFTDAWGSEPEILFIPLS